MKYKALKPGTLLRLNDRFWNVQHGDTAVIHTEFEVKVTKGIPSFVSVAVDLTAPKISQCSLIAVSIGNMVTVPLYWIEEFCVKDVDNRKKQTRV